MKQTPELWKATYQAQTPEELNEAYKQWACDYDKDTCRHMGYVGPEAAAKVLDRHLESRKCRVLDAGCGTGLVGEALNEMGYENIDGMDYSPDMIGEAEKKDVYRRVFQADLNRKLDMADGTYDAAICVGTFTYAHVGPDAFEELIRVTRPGGTVCFTIRDGAYQEYGYRKAMLQLEEKDLWRLSEMHLKDYLVEEDVTARFCAYRVLDN